MNTTTPPTVSVVLPCRNEEASLRQCIQTIKQTLAENDISGEIIVSDSSTDTSPEIARQEGATLVKHDQIGYGRAYLEGFKLVKSTYVFCADPDNTYDFAEIPRFIKKLEEGYDLVVGNRFAGEVRAGSMPFLHRYLGNPALSLITRIFFSTPVRDVHCGMRAIRANALQKLSMHTEGMEFASEMIIEASKKKFRVTELPITYYQRAGTSKLRSFPDGWRHLRLLLLHSPRFLFWLPGIFLLAAGIFSMAWIYNGNAAIFGIELFVHPMFLSSLAIILGYQILLFSFFARIYSHIHLKEPDKHLEQLFKHFTLERGVMLGVVALAGGTLIFSNIISQWVRSGFGALDQIKNSILALTLLTIGIQTVFSAFMFSILSLKTK